MRDPTPGTGTGMIITIIGTESLGVRGLSCSVELKNRKIFIDPGIALGWSRQGFLPHPFQVAIGARIKEQIISELQDTTDIIFSHFDGDHCPLFNPNPYQLGISEVQSSLETCRLWGKAPQHSPPTQQKRRKELSETLHKDVRNAEGMKEEPFAFSHPVPHGSQGGKENSVIMSRIEEDGTVFVHASDIQLVDEQTVETIMDWKADIVLASGPPLYHYASSPSNLLRERAWNNAITLSQNVDTLIIDHHLLRSEEGIDWLDQLKQTTGNTVFSAADFMGRSPLFLEAWRKELYEWLPVPHNWHDDYGQGKTDCTPYRSRGWECLIRSGKITPCKWYYACPIKAFTDAGKLERDWIEQYCLVGNTRCIRYEMEERGTYHPDNMLPNGAIRDDL